MGTATLGALIGAGGYGQPIFTGIRLSDTAQILEGAVPAALMALLVQAIFDRLKVSSSPKACRGRTWRSQIDPMGCLENDLKKRPYFEFWVLFFQNKNSGDICAPVIDSLSPGD